MTRREQPHLCPEQSSLADKKRPAWRQRLVDAERGMSHGLRSDSTFFVHFFIASIVVATAAVLRIELLEWVVLVLAITLVIAAEMFNKVLRSVWQTVGHHLPDVGRQALRIGTAAVFVTIAGAVLAVGLIFGHRLSQLLGG